MKINYFSPEEMMKELEDLSRVENANQRASEAVKEENVNALADELSERTFFSQEKINKLLINALVNKKLQCIHYLTNTNSSGYIADVNACKHIAAKHICIKGDLEHLKSFMHEYNIDIYCKGIAENYHIGRGIYRGGIINQDMRRLFLNMDTPTQREFDVFTYAVTNNHLHIMEYLLKECNYSLHHNFELSLEVASDNDSNTTFDFLMEHRPSSAYFSKTFLIAISNKNKHIINTLLQDNLVSVYDVLEQAPKENGIFSNSFFETSANLPIKVPKSIYFNSLNLALRFFDKEIVDTLFAHGAKIAHHNYITLEDVTSKETFKYLALNYNLPNNHIVHTQMHKVLKSNDYEEMCSILEKRDLAKQLENELPCNTPKNPQHKI